MATLLLATGTGIVRVTCEGSHGVAGRALVSPAVCVVANPLRPGEAYAGGGDGVHRSPSAGRTWGRTPLGGTTGVFSSHGSRGGLDVCALAISASDGSLYAGTRPSRLFRGADNGNRWVELEALQEIPSRRHWRTTPRHWMHHVRCIAPSPHAPGALLVGIEQGGVMLSEDAGCTFSDHRAGADGHCNALAWHPRIRGWVLEAGAAGIFESHDGGRTWRAANDGLKDTYCYVLAAHPERDEWYTASNAGAWRAHFWGDAEAVIYRRRGDGPWEPIMGGLPPTLGAMPYALACTSDDLWVGLFDGRLLRLSRDADRWETIALTGERIKSVLGIAVIG